MKPIFRTVPQVALFWKGDVLQTPFTFLLFLFFFTSSADLIHFHLLFMKIKMTNLIAFFTGLSFLGFFKSFIFEKKFTVSFFLCFISLFLSFLFGENAQACFYFLVFFVFNFIFYFSIPYQAFRWLDANRVWRLYAMAFLGVGFYALLQLGLSVVGIYLPCAHQTMGTFLRGQGFSYEPSYYALYMTPYVVFYTVYFLLQTPEKRKLREILIPNLLFLASTSTGCFFAYLMLAVLLLIIPKATGVVGVHIGKLFLQFALCVVTLFALFSFFFPKIMTLAFLKFFYVGFGNHHSFMERWEMIVKYWQIFCERPFLGTGLGGATTYLSQKEWGFVNLDDPTLLSNHELIATNVTMEVLASLGLLGGMVFFGVLLCIAHSFWRVFKEKSLSQEERVIVTALAISLGVLFFVLQFNQSIMRSYVWIHVGMCMAYLKVCQESCARRSGQGLAGPLAGQWQNLPLLPEKGR